MAHDKDGYGTSGYFSYELDKAFHPAKTEEHEFTTSGSLTGQTQYLRHVPLVADVILPAWQATERIKDEGRRSIVRAFLSILQSVLLGILAGTKEVTYLPPLTMNLLDDGAAVAEWVFKDFRIGFSFEIDPSESSWYIVSNKNLEEVSESGLLGTADLQALLFHLVSFAMTNS